MTNTEQIAQIEKQIKNAKRLVDMANSLDRLTKNRDFQKVVLEGYMENEAVRLVHAKGNPETQKPERQEAISKAIDGIANFVQYLNTINQLAVMAGKDVADSEAVLDEMRAEDAQATEAE